eukprot:COSAG01_NODE_11022_length_2025_cov_10.200415_3_plen_30_part_01
MISLSRSEDAWTADYIEKFRAALDGAGFSS